MPPFIIKLVLNRKGDRLAVQFTAEIKNGDSNLQRVVEIWDIEKGERLATT